MENIVIREQQNSRGKVSVAGQEWGCCVQHKHGKECQHPCTEVHTELVVSWSLDKCNEPLLYNSPVVQARGGGSSGAYHNSPVVEQGETER